MDVCVDTIAFENAKELTNQINILKDLTDGYKYVFEGVEQDFSTVNYDKANECMSVIASVMSQMQEDLDCANRYLDRLKELIEKYYSLKY